MSKKRRISNQAAPIRRPMREGEDYPYDVFPTNTNTGAEKILVATVKGITEARAAVSYHNSKLSRAEKDEGWIYKERRSTGRLFNRILVRRGNGKSQARGKGQV